MEEINLTQMCKKKRRSVSTESYSSNLNSEYESSINSLDEIKEQTIKNVFSYVNDCAIDLRKREPNDVIKMKNTVGKTVTNRNELNNSIQNNLSNDKILSVANCKRDDHKRRFSNLNDFKMLQNDAENQLNNHHWNSHFNSQLNVQANNYLNSNLNTQTNAYLDGRMSSHLYNPHITQFISTSNQINHPSLMHLKNRLQLINYHIYPKSTDYLEPTVQLISSSTDNLPASTNQPIINSSHLPCTASIESFNNLINPIPTNSKNNLVPQVSSNHYKMYNGLMMNDSLARNQFRINSNQLNEDVASTNDKRTNEIDLLKEDLLMSQNGSISSNDTLEEIDDQNTNKMEHKRERNRQAALRCRKKKLDRIKSLKMRKDKVEDEIKFLNKEAEILRCSNNYLKSEFMKHLKWGCNLKSDL